MTRAFVRAELIEDGIDEATLRQFDALTQEQFELWYLLCYKAQSS